MSNADKCGQGGGGGGVKKGSFCADVLYGRPPIVLMLLRIVSCPDSPTIG